MSRKSVSLACEWDGDEEVGEEGVLGRPGGNADALNGSLATKGESATSNFQI